MSATAFVPNLERILLAVDDGANGRFASRLAGLLAGSRGMPVTILNVAAKKKSKTDGEDQEHKESELGNRQMGRCRRQGGGLQGIRTFPKVDVIVRKHDVSPSEAIATEAQRGYDLLVVGIDDVMAKGGGFHDATVQAREQVRGLACNRRGARRA